MNRIRQLRLARGWSMDELLASAGGVVSKSALSKYELGEDCPSAVVAKRLGAALGVKTIELFGNPEISVQFTGYRKTSKMTNAECAHTEAAVAIEVEKRLGLARLLKQERLPFRPQAVEVTNEGEVENAAETLRKMWGLGTDPVVAPIACLESCGVQVLVRNGPAEFTGLSGVANDSAGKPRAIVVVCRTDQCGERQGLTAIHEIGHVYCRIREGLESKKLEKWMYRFSAAFHAPASFVRRAFGEKRHDISIDELLTWKKTLRLSMGALIYRLADLEIISENLKRSTYIAFKKLGWDKKEPMESPPEQPSWLRAATLRLYSEGAITHKEAEKHLGEKLPDEPFSLRRSHEFLKLPIVERRRLMEEAADRSAEWYAAAEKDGVFEVADSE